MTTTTQDIIDSLDANESVAESYILVRELRIYLKIAGTDFAPRVGIRIYQSSVLKDPFHFAVSHQTHTPVQAAPYFPSNTSAPSEKEAIRRAIDTTTSFIKHAIAAGHVPEDSWLVANENF